MKRKFDKILPFFFLFVLIIGSIVYLKSGSLELHYVIDCNIYNEKLETIKSMPGSYCEFLSNGNTLIGIPTRLTLYDPFMRVIWEKKLSLHHSFNKSSDESKLFVLTNSFHPYLNTTARFDDIEILQLATGETLNHWSSFDHREKLLSFVLWPFKVEEHPKFWDKNSTEFSGDFEFFHFNSIYEIPENKLSSKFDFLRPGGMVVNTGVGPVLFFDKDLKLVHHILLDPTPTVNLHDIQVLPSGKLLIYRNRYKNEYRSQLQKYDFESSQIVWIFNGSKEIKDFYSWRFGSIQELEDRYVYSDLTAGGKVVEISKEGKWLRDFNNLESDPHRNIPKDFLKVKKVDLSSYLSKQQGN